MSLQIPHYKDDDESRPVDLLTGKLKIIVNFLFLLGSRIYDNYYYYNFFVIKIFIYIAHILQS